MLLPILLIIMILKSIVCLGKAAPVLSGDFETGEIPEGLTSDSEPKNNVGTSFNLS